MAEIIGEIGAHQMRSGTVSDYPIAELQQIIRFKVSRGTAVDVDALVAIASPHFPPDSLDQLARIIRMMVAEAGGQVHGEARSADSNNANQVQAEV